LKDTEGQELEKRIADAKKELDEMKDDVRSVLYTHTCIHTHTHIHAHTHAHTHTHAYNKLLKLHSKLQLDYIKCENLSLRKT